jgi:hypothetical protein
MKIGQRKPVIVATAVAAGVLAVGIGVTVSQAASAASSSPSATPSGRPSGAPDGRWGPGGPGRGPGGPGGFGGFGGFGGPGGPGGGLAGRGGQLLHAEDFVRQGTKVVTLEEQSGKVTAVSATSITVKSTDGFTATYVVDSSTKVGKKGAQAKIADVAVGDTVRIEGVKSAGAVTVTHLMDGQPPRRPAYAGPPQRQNGSSAAPTPAGSA